MGVGSGIFGGVQAAKAAANAGKSAEGSVQVGMNFQKMMENMKYAAAENAAVFGTPQPKIFVSERTPEGDLLVLRAHAAAREAIKAICPQVKVGLTLSLHDLQAQQWFAQPHGQQLLEAAQPLLEEALAGLFGGYLVHCGPAPAGVLAPRIQRQVCLGPPGTATQIHCEEHAWPLAEHAADVVLLQHSLEFSASPQLLLREAARCVRPGGHLLICAMNPWSSWGVRQQFADDGFIALRFKARDEFAALALRVEQATDGAEVTHVHDRPTGGTGSGNQLFDVRDSRVHAAQGQRATEIFFLGIDDDHGGMTQCGRCVTATAELKHRFWNGHSGAPWGGAFATLSSG